METKAIIFDLGRVLVNFDIRKGVFKFFNIDFPDNDDAAVQTFMHQPIFKQYCEGKFTPVEFYENLKTTFNLNVSFEEFKVHWCGIFYPMTGMHELLEKLSKNYRLGLLSDTDPLHWQFVNENYELVKFIPKPVLSFQAKMVKPAKEIFQLAAQSVDCRPENCIYIDDLPKNVAGAESIGMHGIKFVSPEKLIEELNALGVKV
jgi:putative hydrolase of the HAD superfamily